MSLGPAHKAVVSSDNRTFAIRTIIEVRIRAFARSAINSNPLSPVQWGD
jgi:hypothetical protein